MHSISVYLLYQTVACGETLLVSTDGRTGDKRTADRGKQLFTLTLFLISCQENNRDRLSSYHISHVWRREGGSYKGLSHQSVFLVGALRASCQQQLESQPGLINTTEDLLVV